jgi:hypothetical protein
MLCAVPLVLLILSRIVVQMAGGFVPDPDYGYLFNGLEILDLHPPSYYDHPGAPLEMLAALVILLAWLARLPFEFIGLLTSVFTRAELYLLIINVVLVALIAGAVFWFGRQLRATTGSLAAALVGQASILLCFPALIALNRVTPEPLLLAANFALVALLTPFVLGGSTVSDGVAKIIGLVIGFAIATKFTALPLLAAVLYLPDTARQKKAGLYAAGGFILFTLPTAHHYPQMLHWIFNLSTRQGGYGTGAVGLPGIGLLLEHSASLLRQTPEIFTAAAVYFVTFLLGPVLNRRLFGVSALTMVIQILMCMKASEARYLTPVVAIIALANAGLIHCAASQAARTVLGALLAAGIGGNALAVRDWARDTQAVNEENQRLLQQMADQGCVLIPYYTVRMPLYSVTFGNEFTNNHFGPALRARFPHAVTYDIAHKQFSAFGAPVAATDVKARLGHSGCVRLVGSPVERHAAAFGIAPRLLTLAGRSGHGINEMAVYDYHLFER